MLRRFLFAVALAGLVTVAAVSAPSQGAAPQAQPLPTTDVLVGRLDFARESYLGGSLAAARQTLFEVLTLVREARRAQEARPAILAKGQMPRAGRDVEMPGLLRRREPVYPIEAAKRGITGYVAVEFVIAKSGEVRNARVAHSVPELDAEALSAIKGSQFDRALTPNARDIAATMAFAFELRTETPPTDEMDLARFYVQRADYASAETPISRAIATLARALSCEALKLEIDNRPRPPGGAPVKQAEKIKDVTPEYPAAAQSAKVSGAVGIEAVVGPNGRLDCLRVVKSIPLLDQAALDAVSKWEYTPALLPSGEAIPVVVVVESSFTLK